MDVIDLKWCHLKFVCTLHIYSLILAPKHEQYFYPPNLYSPIISFSYFRDHFNFVSTH